jgi:hypothetical protein
VVIVAAIPVAAVMPAIMAVVPSMMAGPYDHDGAAVMAVIVTRFGKRGCGNERRQREKRSSNDLHFISLGADEMSAKMNRLTLG